MIFPHLPPLGNLALRQPVVQSSTHSFPASQSVDGSSSGNWDSKVCTSTLVETDPWWRVDLGRSYLVDEVRILNRVDCCPERLHDFEIRVGEFSLCDVQTQRRTRAPAGPVDST